MKILNRILAIVLFYSKIFCDFGESFTVLDTNGEAVKSCLISYISHDNEGIVTTFEDQRHDLEDGSYVRFTDIKGMIELTSLFFICNYLNYICIIFFKITNC